MKNPKERVLDFIAVRQLARRAKGPSSASSVPREPEKPRSGNPSHALSGDRLSVSPSAASGTRRKSAAIAKPMSERCPERFIQSMKKAGTSNPVFLLDEIDKMSSDFSGDPASALLEVLDPEQNTTFVDHYLEVPYDLSDVMFITTANSAHTIPHPLRDRMEIIEIPGYTEFEKLNIAEDSSSPSSYGRTAWPGPIIRFRKDAIRGSSANYTMESGVRNLERQIAQVVRKLAREAVRQGYRSAESEAAEAIAEEAAAVSAETAAAAAAATGPVIPPGLAAVGAGSKPLHHRTTGTAAGDSSFWDDRESRPEHENPENDDLPSSGYDEETIDDAPESGALQDGEEISGDPDHDDPPHHPAPHPPAAVRTGTAAVGVGERDVVRPSSAEPFRVIVTAKNVQKYLGHPRYHRDLVYRDQRPGLAHGLAWTENGGTSCRWRYPPSKDAAS